MSTDTLAAPTAPSAGRRVARAATIVMLAFVASRVLGLARDMVIAARFGDLPVYSAYVAAFRIPDLIFNLIAGGALGSAFLPVFTQYLTNKQEEVGWRLASAVANWMLVGLGTLALLAAVFAPWLAGLVAPGFSPELLALTARLMRFILISTVIFSLSGLLMSILNAYEHFLTPAIAPVMYNLGILFGALVLAPHMGIFGLAWGVILGASAHALVQLPAVHRFGIRYAPVLGRRDEHIRANVRRVLALMGPRVLGAGVVQLMFVANTIIASYYDPRVVNSLGFAWSIMLLPHGILAASVATATFPTFSRMAAAGDQEGMRTGLAQTLRALLFFIIPAAVGLVVLRVPVVQLLYERGPGFPPEMTQAVAWALGFYALGLVGHALIEIMNRAFFALQNTWTPVAIGVAAMLGNIALSILLAPTVGDPTVLARGPQGGLALANAIAASVETVVLLWLLHKRMRGIRGREILWSTARAGAAAAAMGLTLWGLLHSPVATALPNLLFTPLAIGVGGAVYLVAAWLLGAEEARLVPAILLRRRGER